MKNSRLKTNISYLFLVLFLTMKMTSLHALSHVEEDEHDTCSICEFAMIQNLTPTISPNTVAFQSENIEVDIQREVTNYYSFNISKTLLARELFSRPPPSVV